MTDPNDVQRALAAKLAAFDNAVTDLGRYTARHASEIPQTILAFVAIQAIMKTISGEAGQENLKEVFQEAFVALEEVHNRWSGSGVRPGDAASKGASQTKRNAPPRDDFRKYSSYLLANAFTAMREFANYVADSHQQMENIDSVAHVKMHGMATLLQCVLESFQESRDRNDKYLVTLSNVAAALLVSMERAKPSEWPPQTDDEVDDNGLGEE